MDDVNPTDAQKAILDLLYTRHQLTTAQIWQSLHPDRPKRYTERELVKLTARRWVKSHQVYEARGKASPQLWTLLRGGADAIGVKHGSHFYRRSPATEIEHRGVILELERQISAAGWEFIAPVHYGPAHPKPTVTRQARYLMDAIEARETLAIHRVAADPTHPDRNNVPARRDRLNTGELRHLVPRTCNDYVVFRPGIPALTCVVILHPPKGGRAFWLQEAAKTESQAKNPPRPGRMPLYRPITRYIPICAVIPNPKGILLPLIAGIKAAGVTAWGGIELGEYLQDLLTASTRR